VASSAPNSVGGAERHRAQRDAANAWRALQPSDERPPCLIPVGDERPPRLIPVLLRLHKQAIDVEDNRAR
jgi:hypothetical protein